MQESLQKGGIKISGKHLTNQYLSNKHIDRYLKLTKWMRLNALSMDEASLNDLYKIDVVVRRKLTEILKPLEVEISSWVKYYIQFNSISIIDLYEWEVFEKIKSLPNRKRKKRIVTKVFLDKALLYLSKKYKTNDLVLIVDKMTFGQLVALISLLKEEHIEQIFSEKSPTLSKQKIVEILNQMVFLRNLSAHNSILFSTDELKCNKKTVKIPELIESLGLITREGYLDYFKSEIIRYKNNSINKYAQEDKERKSLLEKLFDCVISELIGV